MKYCLSVLFSLMFFAACNTIDVYEKTIAIPVHEWSSNNKLNFSFSVKDSSSYYNIFFVIRHSESYHFNNIWLNLTTAVPKQKPTTQKINLLLANNNGWIGTSMDDIIEQRVPIFSSPLRLNGDYTFTLQQIMREDPLQNVLNVGIRVEKVVR